MLTNLKKLRNQLTIRSTKIQWLLFIFVACIWGSSYFWIKLALKELTSLELVTARVFLGTCSTFILLLFLNKPLAPRTLTLSDACKIAILSFLAIVLPFNLLTWGESRIDSGLTGILNSTVPLFTCLLSSLLLRGRHAEQVNKTMFIGLIFGFVGVLTLMSRGIYPMTIHEQSDYYFYGSAAVVLASFCYACAALFIKRYLSHIETSQMTFLMLTSASFVLVPTAVASSGDLLHLFDKLHLLTYVSVLWLGMIGSSLAYILYFRLVTIWGITKASFVMFLAPFVGITLGILILHEALDSTYLAGSALILLGLATLRKGPNTNERPAIKNAN